MCESDHKSLNPSINQTNNRLTIEQSYEYDANGNLTKDADGKKFTCDALNKQTEVKNSGNQSLGKYIYDGEGKRVKKLGNLENTLFVYDAFGSLIAEYAIDNPPPPPSCSIPSNCLNETDYPSRATIYRYNAQGKMVEVIQGEQHRYFKYDSLGRLIRVRQPEQNFNNNLDSPDNYNSSGKWTAAFAYDMIGNVKRATDANGVNIIYEYDKANRVTKRCYTKPNIQTSATQCSQISGGDASLNTPAVTYFYDGLGLDGSATPREGSVNSLFAKGKLTKVTSSVSETRYTQFDYLGRLLQSEQRTPLDGENVINATPRVSSYKYNFSGALIKETYPSDRVVENQFEPGGDLLRVYGSAGTNAPVRTYANSFSFTASGGISQMRLGNGRWETAKFNERMQVTELGLGNSSSDASLWKAGYEYGELDSNGTGVTQSKNTGNIARQTISFAGLSNPLVQTYRYDSLYRLTEAKEMQSTQQNWIQQFGYDRYGNRTSINQNITGIAYGQITQTPAVDPMTNRFTSGNYSYDLNGNIVRDVSDTSQIRSFTFNGDNKQTEIKDNNGAPIGRYFYDGEGRRVRKVTNLETTIFVYDGLGKLVAEYSTEPSPTPQTKYLTEDHLGTPRIITDASGQVTARRDFLPFGEDLPAGVGSRSTPLKYGATADDIRQKFTGYQKDKETSLDFAEARMYENRFGRFTAVDPLLASGRSANPQTFNRYVYTSNNPIGRVDRNGKIWGKHEDGTVRWFAKKLGTGFSEYRPENWTYKGENGKYIRLSSNSKNWRYVDAPTPAASTKGNETVRRLVGGFPEAPFTEAARGVGKGVGNIFVGVSNTLTDVALNSRNGIYMPSLNVTGNPLSIPRFSFNTPIERNFGYGFEYGLPIASGAAVAPFASAGTSLSIIPTSTRTVFSGHGAYEVIGNGTNYPMGSGILTVPEGTSVTVYSRLGTSIENSLGNAIETNTVPAGAYTKTYESGSRMPNFTLDSIEPSWIQGNPVTVNQPTRLSEILKPNMGECHWAACSDIIKQH